MPRFTRYWSAIIVALSVALAIGCGEDVSTSDDDEPRANQRDEVPDDIDDQSELLHQSPGCEDQTELCTLTPTVGDDLPLTVQLVNADGDPIENALIDFEAEPLQSADAAQLTATSALTDGDGIAETRLQAGDEDDPLSAAGDVEVTAAAADDDEINELEFLIGINTKDAAAYIIHFDHQGESSPDHVRPLLLDRNTTCDEARDNFFDNGIWDSDVTALPDTNVLPDGSINTAQLSNVDNGDAYTVVGVAQQEFGNEDVDVAYGCNDDAEEVQDGINVSVEVPLNDHIPHIDDVYNVNHNFNLTDALPDSVQQIIDLLGTLADNPGEFIIGGDDSVGLVDDILLDVIKDLNEDLADAIEGILSQSGVVELAQDFINNQIDEWLPDWASDAFTGVGDITDMLQEFAISGRMLFDAQPVPALGENDQPVGLLYADDTQQQWDSLIFQWSVGCDDAPNPDECAQVPVSASDLGSEQADLIEGSFDATVYGTNSIEIERHAISLHYGALLIGLIEKVILPRLLGDDITSINDLFGQVIDCDGLADQVADPGDQMYDFAKTMCQDLQDEATNALYEYVEESLVADGDEHFRIKTPSDSPCQIQQPESYPSSWPGEPLPFIQQFGHQDDDGMGCDWDVEINYSDGDEPDQIVSGTFEGDIAN